MVELIKHILKIITAKRKNMTRKIQKNLLWVKKEPLEQFQGA